jgi:hypothetical protein
LIAPAGCRGPRTEVDLFSNCSPAAGTIATFDFTECRHISLVARQGSYNNLLPLWRGDVACSVGGEAIELRPPLIRYDAIIRCEAFERQVPTRVFFIFLEHRTGTNSFFSMEPSTQYRKFAEECRLLVKSAKTVEERKVLQEMEAAWMRLAKEAGGKSS